MHFHSINIAKKSFPEVCRYSLNGEKHVLPINPGRSCSNIVDNCMGNKTYIALSLSPASRSLTKQWCKCCLLMYHGSSLHSEQFKHASHATVQPSILTINIGMWLRWIPLAHCMAVLPDPFLIFLKGVWAWDYSLLAWFHGFSDQEWQWYSYTQAYLGLCPRKIH